MMSLRIGGALSAILSLSCAIGPARLPAEQQTVKVEFRLDGSPVRGARRITIQAGDEQSILTVKSGMVILPCWVREREEFDISARVKGRDLRFENVPIPIPIVGMTFDIYRRPFGVAFADLIPAESSATEAYTLGLDHAEGDGIAVFYTNAEQKGKEN